MSCVLIIVFFKFFEPKYFKRKRRKRKPSDTAVIFKKQVFLKKYYPATKAIPQLWTKHLLEKTSAVPKTEGGDFF